MDCFNSGGGCHTCLWVKKVLLKIKRNSINFLILRNFYSIKFFPKVNTFRIIASESIKFQSKIIPTKKCILIKNKKNDVFMVSVDPIQTE